MQKQPHKFSFTFKRILTAALLLANITVAHVAFAADNPCDPANLQKAGETLSNNDQPACEDIGKRIGLTCSGWFTTIINEQFTNSSGNGVGYDSISKSNGTVIRDCLKGAKYAPDASSSGALEVCKIENGLDQNASEADIEAKCGNAKPILDVYTDVKQGCDTSSAIPGACNRVQVIFAKSGTNLLYSYVSLIYKWAAGTVGIVCVLFIIVGGFQMTTAGDSGRAEEAKSKIMQSLLGLVLLLLSGIILYTVNPTFFTK